MNSTFAKSMKINFISEKQQRATASDDKQSDGCGARRQIR